jgi:probable F420-dependent oxidoreductase
MVFEQDRVRREGIHIPVQIAGIERVGVSRDQVHDVEAIFRAQSCHTVALVYDRRLRAASEASDAQPTANLEAVPHRPFRFGVTGRGDSLAQWRDFARKAEDLGYATLLLPDHFGPQLAPLIALSVAAQATRTLRLGTLVLDNDFRHPAVLAKEVATLDLLTDGRFELGIGTGSAPADNEQIGIPLDPPATRYERIVEMIQILKSFFADDTVTFNGRHYQISGLRGFPKPVQRPHPPLLMGARGPRMLRLAAKQADIIGVMGPDESASERLEVVRAAAGDRYAQLEFNALYLRVQVDGQPSTSLPQFSAMEGLTGSKSEIIEHLQRRRELLDVSYVAVIGTAIDAFAPVVAELNGT